MTETMTAVVLITADGEARNAQTYPDGSYSCPFCSAAVISPDGWAEMQSANAAAYAKSGETYAPEGYSHYMRETWTARACSNPCCLVTLSAEQCAATRARNAERDAEDARRKRSHELAMGRIAEGRAAQDAACRAAHGRCDESGECYACWAHSTYSGVSLSRERWITHRAGTECAHVRRYGS